MIKGSCHCGAFHWAFDGVPEGATTCNCTICRRYGTLWAYDNVDERIHVIACISTSSTFFTTARCIQRINLPGLGVNVAIDRTQQNFKFNVPLPQSFFRVLRAILLVHLHHQG